MFPLYLFFTCVLFVVFVDSAPQVPYDYVPYGRGARRDAGHPHDVHLNYERLFPARRKFVDSPHVQPNFGFKK
ncbi:hypothetical protein PYW08_010390 [Mythimna loreyi]|uniref:Uncharacterized protein n=1 Tax=Mythimna loreyi TaxID=667449 RepID=A0ACC2Q593_9NEOP|nr:hypothetical protein PYW08_010390 [Mythimna loreyi]